jgi:Ca2+-transporting ATPase
VFTRPFANRWLWGAVIVCLILQLAAVYWPFLQVVLRTVSLNWAELGVAVAAALAPVAVVELVKLVQRWSGQPPAARRAAHRPRQSVEGSDA